MPVLAHAKIRQFWISRSQETYCYSDFPYPADFPIFLPPAKMVEYLKLYANAFQLNDCIQYNTEVLSVTQCDDFSNNGRWKIELRNVNTGSIPFKLLISSFMRHS